MGTSDFGIAALVGAALPFLIAIVVQSPWGDGLKALVAFVLCMAAGTITAYLTDSIHFTDPGWDWVAWFGTIYTAAMVTWRNLYHPTNVTDKIEAATSVGTIDGTPRPR